VPYVGAVTEIFVAFLILICVNWGPVFICIMQLVLSANFTETSICQSGYTVVSVCLFPRCESNCAWLAGLPRPKAGRC